MHETGSQPLELIHRDCGESGSIVMRVVDGFKLKNSQTEWKTPWEQTMLLTYSPRLNLFEVKVVELLLPISDLFFSLPFG